MGELDIAGLRGEVRTMRAYRRATATVDTDTLEALLDRLEAAERRVAAGLALADEYDLSGSPRLSASLTVKPPALVTMKSLAAIRSDM